MHVKTIITPFNPTINGLRTKGNKNREMWNLNAQYDDYKENIGLQQVNRIIIQDRKLLKIIATHLPFVHQIFHLIGWNHNKKMVWIDHAILKRILHRSSDCTFDKTFEKTHYVSVRPNVIIKVCEFTMKCEILVIINGYYDVMLRARWM